MKSYFCLSTLAGLVFVAGCAPRLAETPLGKEEKRWEAYIKKSYPAWKPPQTVPPATGANGKTESPAVKFDAGGSPAEVLPAGTADKLTPEAAVTDRKSVPADAVTTIDIKEKSRVYVVQKNDTLWKISKKFYNDGAKWKQIQAANAAVLKGSDKVHPGMTLEIPQL